MSKHLRSQAIAPRSTPISSEQYSDLLVEIRDRVRRIETRTTKYIEAQGFDTGVVRPCWLGKRPDWEAARIALPTPATTIKEVMAVIPPDYEDEVDLYVGEELIATIYR